MQNPQIMIQSNNPHTTRAVKTGYPTRFGLAKRVTCFLRPS